MYFFCKRTQPKGNHDGLASCCQQSGASRCRKWSIWSLVCPRLLGRLHTHTLACVLACLVGGLGCRRSVPSTATTEEGVVGHGASSTRHALFPDAEVDQRDRRRRPGPSMQIYKWSKSWLSSMRPAGAEVGQVFGINPLGANTLTHSETE